MTTSRPSFATLAGNAVRRAQVYRFLADAFLYPADNWLDDIPLLAGIVRQLGGAHFRLGAWGWDVHALQAEHRRVFGLTGSLCYETECGLPHEFRQSQEMADIAGFYRAFGFSVGGRVRERVDHIAVELEFMYALALKEAQALDSGLGEQAELCCQAQRRFLQDHLGRWVDLLAQALEQSSADGPYRALARFAADFILADAARLDVVPETPPLAQVAPTPLAPDLSCEACPLVEMEAQ